MTGILNILAGALGVAKDTYFNLVSLLLPGNGTNGAQNNTFLDSGTANSGSGFTITRNGNTTQGTFSPFSQTGWGNYFDGSTAYLTVAANSAINDFGTGDFNIECWFYATTSNFTAEPSLISCVVTWATSVAYQLEIRSGGVVYFFGGDSIPIAINSGATTVSVNTWNHVAVSRASGTTRLFVNGTQVSSTSTVATISKSSTAVQIGAFSVGATQKFTGYISNVRIVKGQALYTGNFTPPTAALTTSSVGTSGANVATSVTGTVGLLTCQSNRFFDQTGKTITTSGSPSVTPFSPFAPTQSYSASAVGGSGYFDGTGDYLDSIGTAADWAFMSNSTALWSFECWLFTSSSGAQAIIDTCGGSSSNVGVYIAKTASNTILADIVRGSVGTRVVQGTTTGALTTNAWNHLLVTYDQSLSTQNLKIYINDGSAETFNKTANAPSGSNPTYSLRVGGYNATALESWNGYISSLRISNVVRSASLPTTPYSSDANTKLLLNFTNAGVVDATSKNVLETVGNAQISTTQSKWGGGSISFDGTGDYLLTNGSVTDLLAFGTGDFCVEMWVRFNSLSGTPSLIDGRPASTNGAYLFLYASSGGVDLFVNSAARIAGSVALSTGVWYHVAVARSSSNTRLYVAGNQVGSTYSDTTNYLGAAGRPAIGTSGAVLGNDPLNAYIDDLRITKGNARGYTGSTITVPSAPFPVQ